MSGSEESYSELAKHLDYTLLKPDATLQEIKARCQEAAELGLYGVTVHSSRVVAAALVLEDSSVNVTCVIGFPFGAMDSDIKRYETEAAVDLWAHEIALVVNPATLKDNQPKVFFRELRDVVEAADVRQVKAVFCQGLFSEKEAREAIELAREAGVHTIELLGGVRPEPLVPEDFIKLRDQCPEGMQFKVTGPLLRQSEVLGFLQSGVHWVGTPEARLVLEGDEIDEPDQKPFRD
jgi:deoxyribose-phosphate aldolase